MSDPTNPQARHWRRHEAYMHVNMAITHDQRLITNGTFVASACGRLVDYAQAVGEASEADCSECGVIATALGESMFDGDGDPNP